MSSDTHLFDRPLRPVRAKAFRDILCSEAPFVAGVENRAGIIDDVTPV